MLINDEMGAWDAMSLMLKRLGSLKKKQVDVMYEVFFL
jgi:hypothetical protein